MHSGERTKKDVLFSTTFSVANFLIEVGNTRRKIFFYKLPKELQLAKLGRTGYIA